MNVLHIISGGDKGGGKSSVFTLLDSLRTEINVTVVCFVEGVFYCDIRETDIPSVLFKQSHRFDMRVIPKLIRFIRKNGFDIIHAHGARANFIAFWLRPFIKMPMVTTMHSDYRLDFTTGIYKRILFTALNAFSLRFFDYYIAVSESFGEMLQERGFEEGRIYTVYNAVDFKRIPSFCSRDAFLSRYGIEAGEKVIVGIAGRHDRVKGHDLFIKAAAGVLKKRKDVLFLLAGEGSQMAALQKQSRDLGIEAYVHFLGFVDDMDSYFHSIDINVMTSHTESFPYALLEGALHHKPAVSTAVGGIPDLIRDDDSGTTGMLVPSGDSEALVEKLLELIDSPERRKTLGDALYAFASANFSKESLKNRHIYIYNNILSRQKSENKYFDCMLSGYYGFKNSGDDALLSAIITNLRKEKEDISIVVLTKNRNETSEKHNVLAVHRFDLWRINQLLKCTRLFISGGGTHIQDNSSTRSLLYYATLARWAKWMGLKIMYYANGVGPINKRKNIRVARQALDAADCITLRDPESADVIRAVNAHPARVVVSCDAVMALTPASATRIDDIIAREGLKTKRFFVIAVRSWKHNDADFIKKMSGIITETSLTYSLTPVFITMQQPDVKISENIANTLPVEALVLKHAYEADELIGFTERAQFVLAMRLHALIYAAVAGVPMIGISYDPKVSSFLKYLGQECYVDTVNLDISRLREMIGHIMADPASAREAVRRDSARLKTLAGNDAKIAVELLN